jgi:hypothetical protein
MSFLQRVAIGFRYRGRCLELGLTAKSLKVRLNGFCEIPHDNLFKVLRFCTMVMLSLDS